MDRSIHFGYICQECWTRVPVYTFTRLNGKIAATPPEDQTVECPNCHSSRRMSFSLLAFLERWEGPAQPLPQDRTEATMAGAGAKFYRDFTLTACGPGIPLDRRRAQLVKGTDGCVYIVSPDGTTLIFRDDSAKQLCEKYSKQAMSTGQWDFSIQLNIEIAAPVNR